MKLALIQMDIAFGEPEKNKRSIEQYFAELDKSADTVVLPEMWNTGYDLKRLDEVADADGKDSQNFLSDLAKRYEVNLVGGSVAKSSERGFTNTMYAHDSTGKKLGEYSKVHLFRLMEEEKYLVEGQERGPFTLNNIPSAGLICYDIRFPEWVRAHVMDGAQVLYVVAEWPAPRIDHWRTLLIARAIENQCYVVACNRVGSDPKNDFGGHSIVIDPWGEIVAEADDREQILNAEINLELVEEVRKRIPIFDDRREKLY
ncbi:carbon-nitrogen hydrolase [Halalkalibacillus sediminis]|uniref:Carbon-nitrogen hydrolase n=1 Tax=Halalkalibacillus sediminis TaxID=2018042 RepID=A0A2I0QQS7_9BACI|nr:carbon-nitrogen family hydrolase [Halalkalibacillus sediminis]PKR76695.1 carbon-nitrogen hydrolase [Halalkalibacillus sediminis]